MPEITCPKCGTADVHKKYVAEGKILMARAPKQVDDEWIKTVESDGDLRIIAKKEFLSLQCRDCRYAWAANTADNKDA